MKLKIVVLMFVVLVMVGSATTSWSRHLEPDCIANYFKRGGPTKYGSTTIPPDTILIHCRILGPSADDIQLIIGIFEPAYHVSTHGRREVRFYRGDISRAEDETPYNHFVIVFEDGKVVDISFSCIESRGSSCKPPNR